MDSIRIKNLRSIIDTGDIPIKPLTILVGANSTGKSTFLRTFPLLRQSVETATNNPILWYKQDGVDFGSIEEAIRTSAKGVSFEFNFNLEANTNKKSRSLSHEETYVVVADSQLRVGMELTSRDNNELDNQVAKLTISLGIDKAILEFDKSGKVTHFEVNTRPLTRLFKSLQMHRTANFLPSILEWSEEISQERNTVYRRQRMVIGTRMAMGTTFGYNTTHRKYQRNLLESLKNLLRDSTNLIEKVLPVAVNIGIGGSRETFLSNFGEFHDPEIWNRKVSELTEDRNILQQIRDVFFACHIPNLLVSADQRMAYFAGKVQYLGPLRVKAERYYRLQNLAVEEIDHRGENLPMYLNSLSESQRNEFAEWSNQYFGIQVNIKTQGGQLAIQVKEQNHPQLKNLVDVGFGYSQLLPVMVQLWSLRSQNLRRSPWTKPIPSLIAIEQPELHLHPRLQAQLADVFAYLVKQSDKRKSSAFRLLIETHSETIINRLGQLIQRGDLSPSNVQIVLFEPDKAQGGTTVRTTTYDDEGCLIDWPYGFFLPDLT